MKRNPKEENKSIRIVNVVIEISKKDASASWTIKDDKNNDIIRDFSLNWLCIARLLSRCANQCLDNVSSTLKGDEAQYIRLIHDNA